MKKFLLCCITNCISRERVRTPSLPFKGDHPKLLSWLNWIVLAQHALQGGRGNKCLLLKVLATLLDPPRFTNPFFSQQEQESLQPKNGTATAHFVRARSVMYDGETGTLHVLKDEKYIGLWR